MSETFQRALAAGAMAKVALRDLHITTDIGTYAPGDVVPEAHVLDLDLSIDPARVLIARDGMEMVFDYDPLVAEIARLGADGHYHTQERLMSRIALACAGYPEIRAVEIALRKSPVLNNSGSLGVRLCLGPEAFAALRDAAGAAAP